MKDAAIIILIIYCLIQAFVIWYFFVYKQREIDNEYEKRLKETRERVNNLWNR